MAIACLKAARVKSTITLANLSQVRYEFLIVNENAIAPLSSQLCHRSKVEQVRIPQTNDRLDAIDKPFDMFAPENAS